MNSIAWFLYLSNVVENFGTLMMIALIGVGIMWGVLNVAVPVTEGDVLGWKEYRLWWTRGATALFICGLILTFLPSKNTMYAIAAAQIGEKIAQNEAVQGIASDATKALQQWIKKQIEPETKK